MKVSKQAGMGTIMINEGLIQCDKQKKETIKNIVPGLKLWDAGAKFKSKVWTHFGFHKIKDLEMILRLSALLWGNQEAESGKFPNILVSSD